MDTLKKLRNSIPVMQLKDDAKVIGHLSQRFEVSTGLRQQASARAINLVEGIRAASSPGMMEVFLAEYGLSTDEGVALMCLAEALLRVPDAQTMDELIDDKITPSAWNEHLGKSTSSLVNASTWALMLTGKVLQDGQGVAGALKGAIKRLGEPVIRAAVHQAMREMGRQFVLGQTIGEAIEKGKKQNARGFTFSYDMLGEAALTEEDAARNYDEYSASIAALAGRCTAKDIRENPGISIKLSAIHPRYEEGQSGRVMAELVPRVLALAEQAAAVGMGLNIDAEEADRLDLSLDIVEAVLKAPTLDGWDGFGAVVQAYGKRASAVIDWLYGLATRLDRRIMVRLVKGAYWDTEIKRAQVEGLSGFPVFQRKEATDVSYICCAKQLLGMVDRIYPQFATHNAHTVAAVLEMAENKEEFEFQRLHGMGEALHDLVLKQAGTRCRVYAPVGTHRDLLAYLVRRLLENGANSSFVNQIVSDDVSAEVICADPFEAFEMADLNSAVADPAVIFEPARRNSRGFDLRDREVKEAIEFARDPFRTLTWQAGPILATPASGGAVLDVINPANGGVVGQVTLASEQDAANAIGAARVWDVKPDVRARTLRQASELLEESHGELFSILCREAGKTPEDAVAELREAVDFLRYYAGEAERLSGAAPRGIFTCISPWNFPLAIFAGQIGAALAAGNGVLAKPAEATPVIAHRAISLMHQAGVPKTALQLLPGEGASIGAALTSDARINGVCFTGSTATAQAINRAMAENLAADAPLIAETGGINAMIVDSTALPEQAVQDIVMSAFKSAGQRCSALRVLYVQEDVADTFLNMLYGAMDQLSVGDPWGFHTDVGPIIDETAKAGIMQAVEQARSGGRLLKQIDAPEGGSFVGPAVIKVAGIGDVKREIFGPVLHVATFKADEIDRIVDDINATGYGLTFGMHSRIDDRIEQVTSRIRAGNVYINRNQIGAIVASQPFGGEGLSGTGPKAGGPSYVERFTASKTLHSADIGGVQVKIEQVQMAIDRARGQFINQPLSQRSLPGPTGESNQLSTFARGVILCLSNNMEDVEKQSEIVRLNGCIPVAIAPGGPLDGVLEANSLAQLTGFDGVVIWGDKAVQSKARQAMASRAGAILPLITERHFGERCRIERHICIDTTAAGGNASLLAAAS